MSVPEPRFHTAAEFAALARHGMPGYPTDQSAFAKLIKREDWRRRLDQLGRPMARRRKGRGGGWEYSERLLTRAAQIWLEKCHARKNPASPDKMEPHGTGDAWAWFDGLSEKKKEKARMRLSAIEKVEGLQRAGMSKRDAVGAVSEETGTAASVIFSWFKSIAGLPLTDRLPALAPRHGGRQRTAECDPRAWDVLKTDYLRLSQPSFTSCYRRMAAIAEAEGWTIPPARTLERRIEREIPTPVLVLTREGMDALSRMYPPQERDRTMFHALEAVNADGHKWDVFVRWPDGEIGRPMMVAIQDLYSNKILAWRVDRSENADSVRLAFADVFRNYGIPDMVWLDNGRGFASKWITGGTPTRYRFKVKPEDPAGILTGVGCEVHWTKPYSGQSKPIERAFGDLCDSVAKHPTFEGAYTGNKPTAKPENYGSKAVPLETFLDIVGQGIRLHNAQPNRNTLVCQRRKSFDQAFEESYAKSLIRKAGEEQLRMCLMAAESVRADRRSGAVRLLDNRYWSECLHDHRGQPLTIRFDPDNLHEGVHLYRLDGAYIGFADCIERAGFADTQAAREHGRNRNQFIKATKIAAAAERRMSLDDLARLIPAIEEVEPPETRLVRPLFNGSAALKADAEIDTESQEESELLMFRQLGRALDLKESQQE